MGGTSSGQSQIQFTGNQQRDHYRQFSATREILVHQNDMVLTQQELNYGTLLVSVTAGNRDFTGIVPPSPSEGYQLFLTNIGPDDFRLRPNDTDSAVPNRFLIDSDYTMKTGYSTILTYVQGAWRATRS